MLFIDAVPVKVILIIVTSLIGIFGVAAALNGYLFRPIAWPLRIIIAAAGLLMMDPNTVTDLIGIVLFAIVFCFQYFAGRKRGQTA